MSIISIKYLISVVLLILAASLWAQNSAQESMIHLFPLGNKCVDLVYRERFAEGHKVANEILRTYPDSPAGYFFRAAVYHYQMVFLNTNAYEKQLYETCERGIQLGEKYSANGDWETFFLAAILGVQGNYDRVNGRLVSSLKLAWRSIEILNLLDEQEVVDILYGIGVYEYWVGANARLLWWMPNVKDERPAAFRKLERISTDGMFTRSIVLIDLLEMYLNEKRYGDALSVGKRILETYPENTIALWGIYDAYVGMGDYVNAELILNILTNKINLIHNNDALLEFLRKKVREHEKRN